MNKLKFYMINEKLEFNLSIDKLVSRIKKAIEGHKYISFYYEEVDNPGVKSGFRLVEPYVIGKGYLFNDIELHPDRYYLRAYLIPNTKNTDLKIKRKSVSLSNLETGWRLFRLDRITSLEVFDIEIKQSKDGYEPNDSNISNIIKAF